MVYRRFNCNICNSERYSESKRLTRRLSHEKSRYSVVKCKGCGLYSLCPIPNDDELKEIYRGYAKKGDRVSVEKKRIKEIYPEKISLIRKYKPEGCKILDIGAGLGGFVSTAALEGFDIMGVEYVHEQCELARKLYGVNLICDKIESFCARNDRRFDVVHLHHVLEHLQAPKDTLLIIRDELLAQDGLLLLEVPNQFFKLKKELNVIIGKVKANFPYNPYHHIYFFSPTTLRRTLSKCGYIIYELNQLGPKQSMISLRSYAHSFIAKVIGMGVTGRIEIVAKPLNGK